MLAYFLLFICVHSTLLCKMHLRNNRTPDVPAWLVKLFAALWCEIFATRAWIADAEYLHISVNVLHLRVIWHQRQAQHITSIV